MTHAGTVVGALADAWARLPARERTIERHRLLVVAITTALEWLAPRETP